MPVTKAADERVELANEVLAPCSWDHRLQSNGNLWDRSSLILMVTLDHLSSCYVYTNFNVCAIFSVVPL